MKLIYQIIYSPAINYILRNINKLVSGLVPKIKLPPAGIIKIKLSGGETIKLKTNQTDFVAFWVYWKGLYTYEYTSIFEKIISKVNGFVDIGSNGGLYSLIAAKKSENIKILAVRVTHRGGFLPHARRHPRPGPLVVGVVCGAAEYGLAAGAGFQRHPADHRPGNGTGSDGHGFAGVRGVTQRVAGP